jgi:hypothetical protein
VVTSIATEVNNANAVFEAEVAVHLTLDQLALFSDPDTDPYMAGSTACQLRDQNVAAINGVVNPNDYDIGYVFGTGGGNGCAWYVVCLNDKARGAGLVNVANPVGSATGLLVHEMGHQLGARHTFSSAAGSCGNPGEFNQPDAYEPGSGSTIMSYRGSCAPDNVDLSSIGGGMYYHTYSFDQIINNITNVVACGNAIPTGNNPPVVDAGADYTIPRSTPFVLTGSATDADNDPLTYTWEQFDVAANQRPIDTDTGEGPIIRSVPPTSSPARTIPALADILSNTHRKGEQLPYTDRQLTFRLTARDNRTGAGGVAYDDMAVTVAGDPFFVTSPNGGEVLAAGCPVPITWTVGGGSVAAQASIDYSTNGGSSFASLIASTANDGSADAVLPCTATAQGRVKASGVGNIFFDVSDGNFSVVQTPPTVHVSAMGGAVDDACTFNVTFTATVEDDCGAHAADVQVQALKQTNNFTVGPVMFNAAQVDARHVSVSGSVLVSDVTDSPAKLGIKVIGADACGASSNDTSVVDIVDTTPPSIDVTVAPDQLWPPNHKLQPVTATVMAADNCPNVSFVLTSVTSNEAVNGVGDGDTSPDIDGAALGTADLQMLLRAERSGTGSGRIYTIKYTATDASNNATSASAIVVVPHSKKP